MCDIPYREQQLRMCRTMEAVEFFFQTRYYLKIRKNLFQEFFVSNAFDVEIEKNIPMLQIFIIGNIHVRRHRIFSRFENCSRESWH